MPVRRPGELIWLGARPDEPWAEISEPFELVGDDAETYPPGTPNIAAWIKRQRTSYVTRSDLERVAPSCGVGRRNAPSLWLGGRGSIGESLEILEVFDWIRSALRCLGWRRDIKVYAVNPQLLVGTPVMPTIDHRRLFGHEQKQELWFRAGGRCCICRIRLGPDWHADHVIPWSAGGPTVVENGQALCPSCNHRKHAKH